MTGAAQTGRARSRAKAAPKQVPIEEVTASLKAKLDGLARRLRSEADARGVPWPPPGDWSWAEGVDMDAPASPDPAGEPASAPGPESDADAGDDTGAPAAQGAPAADDPDAAAIALLGQWHVPDREA